MISRNRPCPCGSGKKYKHCCGVGTHNRPAQGRALTNFSFEKFDSERRAAFDICTRALTTLGMKPNIQMPAAPGVEVLMCEIPFVSGESTPIAIVLRKDETDLWLSVGASLPSSVDAERIAEEGMKKYHIPIFTVLMDGQTQFEVRYPICLGALSIENFKAALARLLESANMLFPQVGLPAFSLEVPCERIDVQQESNEIEGLLKRAGLQTTQRPWGTGGVSVIYNIPTRPKTEFAFLCLDGRADVVSVSGTPLAGRLGLREKDGIKAIAFKHSVAYEFRDTVVFFYYPTPKNLNNEINMKMACMNPFLAATNTRELLGLAKD